MDHQQIMHTYNIISQNKCFAILNRGLVQYFVTGGKMPVLAEHSR